MLPRPSLHSSACDQARPWFTALRVTPYLLALCCACAGASEPVLAQGSRCERNADCETDQCEVSSLPGQRICCSVECVPGTVCAYDGSRCVTCDPELSSCDELLELGDACGKNSECQSNNCLGPREDQRCCDAFCEQGCDARGRCVEQGALDSTPVVATSPLTSPTSAGPQASEPDDDTGALPASAPSSSATADQAPSPSGVPAANDCAAGTVRACAAAGALGNCASGQQRCEAGTWSACSVQPLAADACDVPGDDANCNGSENENCGCIEGSEVPCGTSDVGLCELGLSLCVGGEPSECVGSVLPQARDCGSREDNNCDGRPDNVKDEFCPCVAGQKQACDTHPEDGTGNCRAGEQVCEATETGSRWSSCSGAVGPAQADACDLPDDDADCNGVPNEGCIDTSRTTLFAFETDIQGWQIRLTDPESLEANARLLFSSGQGDPKPGSLQVNMPFNSSNQKIEFNTHPAAALDVTGKVLKARALLVSGLSSDTAHPGGIKLFAKSGPDYVYISGDWLYFRSTAAWGDVVLDPADPELDTGEFDPTDVRELGFELRTFGDTTGVSAAVVHVDSLSY